MKLSRFLLLVFCGVIYSATVQAQSLAKLQGQIVNSNKEPISGAHILVPRHNKHAISDKEGHFELSIPQQSVVELTITHIGYHTVRDSIHLDQYNADQELSFQLKTKRYKSATAVITATRTRRNIEEVSEPVTVISDKEIQTSGSTRLSNLLAEQTGLALISDHGTGVQVQGFAPEYTKIMVDGHPMIGRTNGTFDLDRITVGNIEQVEIIKGPSSALWGSDALAGVINIITDKGQRPFELAINSRYATNRALDTGINLSAKTKEWRNNFFINRYSSQGYSLVPGSITPTVPEFQNYTGSYQTSVDISDRVTAEFQARYYREKQSTTDYLGSAQNPTMLSGNDTQTDYSLVPELQIDLGSGFHGHFSNYFSRFQTDSRLMFEEGDSLYEDIEFDQILNKTELQLVKNWNSDNITTAGGGFKYEELQSGRYPSQPSFRSYYALLQHEWHPFSRWDITAGLRYDAHSEYSSELSPKLSTRYKLADWVHLRASVGSGFKAPDFRQLYLDWSNPTVGYSVFGSKNVRERIHELQERGQIEKIHRSLDQLEEIQAEHSWAYNAGVDLYPTDRLTLRINGFRNNVQNQIETASIASKPNGQSIYSYFNLDNTYTQGIEAQMRWKPINQFELTAGYQLLDARLKVNETHDSVNDEGEVITQEATTYKPLFNRSKHSANLKLYFLWEKPDIDANLRGRWFGQYGKFDLNGNGYVDPNEYEDDYMIWDASLAKTFDNRYTLRLGIDNIFDITRPGDLSYLPGRIFYAKVSLQLY